MKNDWVRVSIRAMIDAGELLGALGDTSVSGGWQEDGLIHLYWSKAQWKDAHCHHIQKMLCALAGPTEHNLTVTHIPYEDWNAKWAESVEPIRVGERIIIRPSWKSVEVDPRTIDIVLDPQQAFGTGHHATTQLLIEWLETAICGGEQILDIGTGSGLLAMVALRLGASTAIGIDYDPIAIDCARSYASLNGFGRELDLRVESIEHSSLQTQEQFDMIVANLDGNAFRSCAHVIIPKLIHGGRLYISGILEEDELEISALFSQSGSVLLDNRRRDGWVAMGFQY